MNKKNKFENEAKNRKRSSVGRSIGLYNDVMVGIEDSPVRNEPDNNKQKDNNFQSQSALYPTRENIFNSNLLRINNEKKYYYVRVKTEEKTYKENPISNFIVVPLYTTVKQGGKQIYMLKLISDNQAKVVEFDGETLAIHTAFKKHCMNNGRFNWFGKQANLDSLINMIFTSPMKELEFIPYMGWNEKEGIWIYPSQAYYRDKVIFADEDGIIAINGKYFKVDVDKDDEYRIHPHIDTSPSKEDLVSYFKCLKLLYGQYSILAFGYIAGTMNVDAIVNETDYFPFLYLYGKHGQGKSTALKEFTKMAGINVSLNTPPSLDSLRKGMSRKSSMPFVVDEAENKNDSSKGIDFIKTCSDSLKNNVYMRQDFIRGHKEESTIIRFPVKATLMLSGEVLTSVPSIIQRSVLFDASKITFNEEAIRKVKALKEVPYWVGQYLMRTSYRWKHNFLRLYHEIHDYFSSRGWTNIHIRIRSHYAMFLASSFAAFAQLNDFLEDEIFFSNPEERIEIYQFVYQEMKETQQLTIEDHPAMDFLRKIGLLAKKGQLQNNSDYKCVKEDGYIYLYLAPSNIYEAYRVSERTPFYPSSNKVVKDLQTYSFFIKKVKHRIGASNPTAWLIQLSDPGNPESIKEGIVHPELPDTMIYFYK
ncbi:hypothetical protein C2I06_18415 [Niallia circulans]|uniref:hypothetical protein n=1 Tax=Niallia circulans TaxID=1397 RepID=UPI000F452855|nr:hypothetical protein [Niallia circulans]AYV68695.1 hypothetical protein C2I06_18415 [Niallia circulans]